MQKDYRAYEDENLTIEWSYKENSDSSVQEYFEELTLMEQKQLVTSFMIFGTTGRLYNTEKFRYEGDRIFVFKVYQYRFFCFLAQSKKIIITNAYRKKEQKISKVEKAKAVRARALYIQRVQEGTYYE